MDNLRILFQGNVQIYLQGTNALLPVGELAENQMTYFVGSKRSKLLIRDYRQNSILAAQHALSGAHVAQFADIFNEPAYSEIFSPSKTASIEKIEINLYPTSQSGEFPFLWLGMIDDFRMPTLETEWEVLRPISLKRIAFAAMVKAANFLNDENIEAGLNETVYSFK